MCRKVGNGVWSECELKVHQSDGAWPWVREGRVPSWALLGRIAIGILQLGVQRLFRGGRESELITGDVHSTARPLRAACREVQVEVYSNHELVRIVVRE